MKKQLKVKKLVLNKETVCEIGGSEMTLAKGGIDHTYLPCWRKLSEASRCGWCEDPTYTCAPNTEGGDTYCICQ